MSATLMERNRVELSQDRPALNALKRALLEDAGFSPGTAEIADLKQYFLAAQGYIAYSGHFRVDEDSVHHDVAVSLIPQWIGTTLSRVYEFSDGGRRLALTATQGAATDHLLWERYL